MMTAAARSKDEPMKPDPLTQIEHAQAIIADGDAPLAQLEKQPALLKVLLL